MGKFGLSGNDAIKPMRFLSGGQKSRAGSVKEGGRDEMHDSMRRRRDRPTIEGEMDET